ncbi:MAG: hypothetical protein UV64_C0007G0048 [Parcubacteria group bacterium GW2011_GWC1_43_11b]|nr:MAG: hypothetical protein UV64_C0007G0048 [Parcubacteria group bacterium GW2011_GWC1_43_11b]
METTITQLPDLDLNKLRVYVGKPHTCMCGCNGRYSTASALSGKGKELRGYDFTEEDISDARVRRVVNKIRKNSPMETEVLNGSIFTAIIGNTQYTIYVDEK